MRYFHCFALSDALLVDTDVHSKPRSRVRVQLLLVCGIGAHPHYFLFLPINIGQWYVGLLGNTPAQTGGSAPL
jgi:hypothetical protein